MNNHKKIMIWNKKNARIRLPRLIMEQVSAEKRGCPKKTWLEGAEAAIKSEHLNLRPLEG